MLTLVARTTPFNSSGWDSNNIPKWTLTRSNAKKKGDRVHSIHALSFDKTLCPTIVTGG